MERQWTLQPSQHKIGKMGISQQKICSICSSEATLYNRAIAGSEFKWSLECVIVAFQSVSCHLGFEFKHGSPVHSRGKWRPETLIWIGRPVCWSCWLRPWCSKWRIAEPGSSKRQRASANVLHPEEIVFILSSYHLLSSHIPKLKWKRCLN